MSGPTKEHIEVHNSWAATGLDKYHRDCKSEIEFEVDGNIDKAILQWKSPSSKAAMKEKKDIANNGAVALAWFFMSVIRDYRYVEQTEIGDGVDYRFSKAAPDEDDLNFLDDFHYVEISGILEESKSNTVKSRLNNKHNQIDKGGKNGKPSSVIVTLFSQPKTFVQIHK